MAYTPTAEHRAIANLVAKGKFTSASAKELAAKVAKYDAARGVKNPQRARLPIGKKIKANYIIVNRDGTIQASVPTRALPRVRNTEGFKDARGIFHPIRSGDDYDPEDVGERRAYAPAKKKKKTAAKRRR